MSPLEKLFRLEVEFHRRLRALPPGTVDAGSLHTSYALQTGYELLLYAVGAVRAVDLEVVGRQFALKADRRDVVAARESLKRIVYIGFERKSGCSA
jgi:hypothetical protein